MFDRWVGPRLPYLYFSVRVTMLAVVLFSSAMWVVYGWDSTVQQTFTGGGYGTGIHWSTFQTFALTLYLLTVNVQHGGLSWAALKMVLWEDLYALSHYWRMRRIRKGESYTRWVVDPARGVAFSFFVTTAALFAFENIWVLFYNFLHFGDWMWPVYYAQADPVNPNPFGTYIFVRNIVYFALPLAMAPITLLSASEGKGEGIRCRFRIRWGLDARFILLLFLSAFLWAVWVGPPFAHASLPLSQASLEDVIAFELPDGFKLEDHAWIWPRQERFPQTSYTFYYPEMYMRGYDTLRVMGFWVQDDLVHLINVATKYLMFAAVAYPFMVKVKRNE